MKKPHELAKPVSAEAIACMADQVRMFLVTSRIRGAWCSPFSASV